MTIPLRRAYVDGRWGQIHLRKAGDARDRPPLLMLHPTPKSGWVWEPLMPPLAERRIVLAPDTPAYGASDPPPEPPSIEALAEEMLALIDRLAGTGEIPAGPIDLMGYHTGSVISGVMARMAPDRVRRVVFVSLPAYSAELRAEKVERLAHFPVPMPDGSHLAAMWRVCESLTDPRADTGWRSASVTENLRSGARATWGYHAVFAHDFQATLDGLEQHVLVIDPEDDLRTQTQENVGRIRRCTHVELPGVRHGLFVLERDRIASLVQAFLDAP